MSAPIKIHATGFDQYLEEDRPALYATVSRGNTHGQQLEVFLEYVEPTRGSRGEVQLGYFSVADLQAVVNTAIAQYQAGGAE